MMMGFGLIGTFLVIALIVYVIGWRPRSTGNLFGDLSSQQQTPMEILKQRYARGEIDQEEFEQIRNDLR